MFTITYFMSRLRTLFAIVPLLTPRRVFNLLRAIAYFLVRSDRSVNRPPVMILSLTSRCNFSCIMCKKSARESGASLFHYDAPSDMDIDRLEELLHEHRKELCLVYLHGGEPLYHKHIDRLLSRLNAWRIPYQIGTNGSLLTDRMNATLVEGSCVGVSISIDGGTPETYARMRPGGDLPLLSRNIENLNQLRKGRWPRRPILTASMCVFSINLAEMVDVVEFCHRHGIYKLSVTEGWDYATTGISVEHLIRNHVEATRGALEVASRRARELGVTLVPSFPSLDGEAAHGPIVTPGSKPPRNCLNLYASTWITPDESLLGCSNASMPMGSLADSSFGEIWNDTERNYVQARRQLRRGDVPQACQRCIYTGGFFS